MKRAGVGGLTLMIAQEAIEQAEPGPVSRVKVHANRFSPFLLAYSDFGALIREVFGQAREYCRPLLGNRSPDIRR